MAEHTKTQHLIDVLDYILEVIGGPQFKDCEAKLKEIEDYCQRLKKIAVLFLAGEDKKEEYEEEKGKWQADLDAKGLKPRVLDDGC